MPAVLHLSSCAEPELWCAESGNGRDALQRPLCCLQQSGLHACSSRGLLHKQVYSAHCTDNLSNQHKHSMHVLSSSRHRSRLPGCTVFVSQLSHRSAVACYCQRAAVKLPWAFLSGHSSICYTVFHLLRSTKRPALLISSYGFILAPRAEHCAREDLATALLASTIHL
jgi:hypothetical protein